MQNNVEAHSQAHEIASQRLCPICVSYLRVPGLKQAGQVGVLTGSFILLVDLSSEQQWNICLADTATEGDIQAKWRVLEPLSEHPKA